MPRFTAVISMGTFTVTDTQPMSPVTVLSMAEADLHGPGGGGGGVQIAPTSITVDQIERTFGTPYGVEEEMGFDLHFDFNNTSGSAKEIGSFSLQNMRLGSTIDVENTHLPIAPQTMAPTTGLSRVYPLGSYSPLVVMRGASNYNICAALCYDVLGYDHPINFEYGIASGSPVTSLVRFDVADGQPMTSPTWYTIPDGESRRYTLMFRINDRTNTNIGPAADAPQEWLWTLRGYQQFFRRRFGRPNYRRMGGRDGRPIASFNTSPDFSDPTNNPRGFNPENPTTTGGSPAGYFKFASKAATAKGRNVPRFMIWALSGSHNSLAQYDFRFATQAATAAGDAPATVRPALRLIRGKMQLGLWFGHSCDVYTSGTFTDTTNHPFDPADPSDVDAALAELNLGLQDWRAQMIGFDAYALAIRAPRASVKWLRALQQRFTRAVLVTEAALPDFLHVIAPTYLTVSNVADVLPFWLQHYLNPGHECCLQVNTFDFGDAGGTATFLAECGFTGVTNWLGAMGDLEPHTRAKPRWRELGEQAIPYYSSQIDNRVLVGARSEL